MALRIAQLAFDLVIDDVQKSVPMFVYIPLEKSKIVTASMFLTIPPPRWVASSPYHAAVPDPPQPRVVALDARLRQQAQWYFRC